MRSIIEHVVACEAANLALTVQDSDEDPALSGANCRYEITGFDARYNPSVQPTDRTTLTILMQHGPVMMTEGANGVTEEVLLAVVLDRLRILPACDHNAIAIRYCETALQNLQRRTIDRLNRGVEGTDKP